MLFVELKTAHESTDWICDLCEVGFFLSVCSVRNIFDLCFAKTTAQMQSQRCVCRLQQTKETTQRGKLALFPSLVKNLVVSVASYILFY